MADAYPLDDYIPALDPMQRQVLGANPSAESRGTPRNYIIGNKSFITYDGITDAQNGQPLPQGGGVQDEKSWATSPSLDQIEFLAAEVGNGPEGRRTEPHAADRVQCD